MNRYFISALAICVALTFFVSGTAIAQFGGITIPPSGDNQHSIVTQFIGPVEISVDYNSPNVHAPDGSDRRGKIWGTLVPYGMTNLGFGTCGDNCPWRGGSNENTVFTVSHDVKVQGQLLKAGAYGLHFIPGETEWTVIFSNDSTSWGSFTYNASEDALRVQAKPEKSAYNEWLTYEFIDRQPDQATVALRWEDLQLPLTIKVENIEDLYVEKIAQELRNSAGFTWQNWDAAAQYCLQSGKHLDQGLRWAHDAIDFPFIGQENFTTLMTLSQLQQANGQTAEAKATLAKALNHRTAGPVDIHMYARTLQAQNKGDEAVEIFMMNAKRYPNEWPVEVGLMRSYSAQGKYKEALKHAKLALKQAPDDANRKNIETMIQTLEEGKNIN